MSELVPEMAALAVDDDKIVVREDYKLWVADDGGDALHLFKNAEGEEAEVFYASVGLTENNCQYGGMSRIIFHGEAIVPAKDKPDPIPSPVSNEAQKIIDALHDLPDVDVKRIWGACGSTIRTRNAVLCTACGKQLQGRFRDIGLCFTCDKQAQNAKKHQEKQAAADKAK